MTLTWGEGSLVFTHLRRTWATNRAAATAGWLSVWDLGAKWRACHTMSDTAVDGDTAQLALDELRRTLERKRSAIGFALGVGS